MYICIYPLQFAAHGQFVLVLLTSRGTTILKQRQYYYIDDLYIWYNLFIFGRHGTKYTEHIRIVYLEMDI